MGRHLTSSCHAEPCHPLSAQCRDSSVAPFPQLLPELGTHMEPRAGAEGEEEADPAAHQCSSWAMAMCCSHHCLLLILCGSKTELEDAAFFVPSLLPAELEVDGVLVGFG